jgi:cytochrome c peroxidase
LSLGGDPDDCAHGIGVDAEEAGNILNIKELRGLQLFMGRNNNDGNLEETEGANCSACHVVNWTEAESNVTTHCWAPEGLVPPLFTGFSFENLGIPKSNHPILEDEPVDLGLGAIIGDPQENGKFRVMSLRNISKTRPYGHNGYFTELPDIVHFINTRDVEDWPGPEVADTVNSYDVGNLGLTAADEDALVKFLMALTDDSGRGNHKFANNQTTRCD